MTSSDNTATNNNNKDNVQSQTKRSGSQPSIKGSTEYFTGSVRIDYDEQLLSVNSITKDHESRAQGMV